jgi:hypothetical protein
MTSRLGKPPSNPFGVANTSLFSDDSPSDICYTM